MKDVAIIVGLGILGGAGCNAKPQAADPVVVDEKPPTLTGTWQTSAVPTHAEPTVVKEGAAPLVYMVEGGAVIRVRDVANNRDLSSGFVPGRSIVRVDARRGVVYGDRNVLQGPLPEKGRYQVIVEPSGENVARQGTFQPTPREAR
jgi:hypothetical protein